MAAKQLKPQQRKFLQLLQTKAAGDILSIADIVGATGWKESTIGTYQRKNYFDTLMIPLVGSRYQVLQDGLELTDQDILEAFTQKHVDILNLAAGMRCWGLANQYELARSVGAGAVAHVWAAGVVGQSESVAVKIMNPRPDLLDPSVLDNVRRRFAREAKQGTQILHPNVVRYLDRGDLKEHPFIVMELADEPVADMIKRGRLAIRDAQRIVDACIHGLAYLHAEIGTHRDVKPHNILRFGDRFVLGDLGILKWSDLNQAFTSAGTITRSSVQLGSWFYMAPEQRQDPHQATPASDIYALGVSWYEMLTARVPDPSEIAAKQYPPPTNDQLTNDLIASMVEYQPSARPSAEDVLERLTGLATIGG